jgi:hypothetical protein
MGTRYRRSTTKGPKPRTHELALIVGDDRPAQDVVDHRIYRPALDRRATLEAAMEVVVDPRDQLAHDRMIASVV